jgi:cation diffusion facilitator family transporter
MHHEAAEVGCVVHQPLNSVGRERGLRWVVLLTAAMMLVEISAGYATGSMALLADGWHMATHVGALGLAAAAHALSRRYAAHRAFAFGTGKIRALAGYTSAVILGLVATSMAVESFMRLLHPRVIDYASGLPVAVIGLLVNVASVGLLQAHDDEERHEHDHDHNHRAALTHVIADAFTSILAIGALLAGRVLQVGWLDAVSGMVGGVVILHWGVRLGRAAGAELLDVVPSTDVEADIRQQLEALDDVRVVDLHVWPLGGGRRSCMVTLVTSKPCEPSVYHKVLSTLALAHLTIEVRPCAHGHG